MNIKLHIFIFIRFQISMATQQKINIRGENWCSIISMKEFNLCIRTIRTELKKIIEIGPPIALCYVSCCLNLTIYNLENKLKITRQIDDGRLRMSLFTQSVIITISLSPYLASLSLSLSTSLPHYLYSICNSFFLTL